MPVSIPSNVAHQVLAVREQAGYSLLPSHALVAVSGPDARDYLHGQATQDIAALQPGCGQALAFVDRKALIESVGTIHQWDGQFWLLVEQALVAPTLERLEQYRFTEQLTAKDCSSNLILLTVQGPGSTAVIQALLEQPVVLDELGIVAPESGEVSYIIRRSLTGETGYILAIAPDQLARAQARLEAIGTPLGLQPIADDAWNILRIEAGLPRFNFDMDAQTMLPATGLEQAAVSYNKGCYLGQEVIAKVKTYGSVGQSLVGLKFLDPLDTLPPLDAPCFLQGKAIGTLKSAAFSPTLQAPIALAYLAREHRVPQKEYTLDIAGQAYRVQIVILPFYTAQSASEKAKALYDEGLKQFAEGQDNTAMTLLRQAIEHDPHLADAYEALGVILSRHEQYEEAIALMKKLAELDPEAIMAHTNLSMFYMKLGLKDEAEVEKALATTLEFKKAMAERQQAQTTAQQREAQQNALLEKMAMFEEVLALDPDDALANYGLGNLLNQLERYPEAVPRFERAIQGDPRYTVAYLGLGKALEKTAQAEQARQVYQQGIEVAAKRGDLMPLKEMEGLLSRL